MQSIDVIMVSYNSGEDVSACVNSLAQCQWPLSVFCVENGTEPLPVGLDTAALKFHGISNSCNEGYGRAANRAFEQGHSPWVLLLNPDTRVRADTIETLLSTMESQPRAGVIYPKLINPDGSVQLSCRRFYSAASFVASRLPGAKRWREHQQMKRESHDRLMPVEWALGAAALIRREAFAGQSLFDPRYFLYFEDVDLALAARRRGWLCLYQPLAVMDHAHQKQSHSDPKLFLNHVTSAMRFLGKHGQFRPW